MGARIRTLVAGIATVHDPEAAGAPAPADPVLEAAIGLAASLGATLHLVHAFQLPDPLLWAYSGYTTVPDPRFIDEYAEGARRRLRAEADAAGADASVRCHAEPGPAGDVLCRHAETLDADLVLVGPTRRGKVWRGLLGTTADRVVRGSPAPVLVVRRAFDPAARRVLLTTDLSDLSAAVHERALDLVEALHPGDPDVRSALVVAFDGALPPPLSEDRIAEAAAAELRRFLDARRPRGYPVEPVVRVGDVARELAAEAEAWDAGLVVVGTAGRRGTSRLLLGSSAAGTLRRTSRNVLAIPAAALPRPAVDGVAGAERAEAAPAAG
jgi:nucleotide-binding universal stress UspA family protein